MRTLTGPDPVAALSRLMALPWLAVNTALVSTSDTVSTSVTATPGGPRRRRFTGFVVIGVLALAACTSDPGPRRVAQDIIKAEAAANPALDEKCMLDALEGFSDSELEAIADDLDSTDTTTQQDAQAELDRYQADLAACT